jgi:hypothetical protein
MGDRKRKSGIWHHRVPDYKLVYCGRDGDFPEKELKVNPQKDKISTNKKA